MGNVDRAMKMRQGRESEACLGKSQTTGEGHVNVVRSGGVRFWGTAAQIEPGCSLGKQKWLQQV
jgi:hypothetical protein